MLRLQVFCLVALSLKCCCILVADKWHSVCENNFWFPLSAMCLELFEVILKLGDIAPQTIKKNETLTASCS